jgi:hypothetical protein
MDIDSFAHETMEEMLNSIFLTNVMYFNNAKDVLEFIVVGPMEHNTNRTFLEFYPAVGTMVDF